jgi:hypothetical protein
MESEQESRRCRLSKRTAVRLRMVMPAREETSREEVRNGKTYFFSYRISSVRKYGGNLELNHCLQNSIGYSRIFLAIASLYYMPLHPRTCSLLYSVSCLLDALDGVAARHFQQSTRFGAVLDMVTDRCTTACLLVFLSSAFPRWTLLFQGLISLDLASHYMHMYATLSMGGSDQSHKKVDQSRSRLLHLYYNNRVSCHSTEYDIANRGHRLFCL